jgi:3-deoxy-D-manno-octulosonate 8-phosphate phosphatase KdsC-like HAD superfamily phosphatase
MFRSAVKLGTASAVSSGVGQASAQCRSFQPKAAATLHGKLGEGWVVTDLKQALDEDQVIFGTEEINSTLDSVIAYSTGAGHRASGSSVEVTGMEGAEVEEMDAPLVHMRAAEMQLMAPCDIQGDFNRMLNKLLHNPEVQHACVNALKDDPSFLQILENTDSTPINIPMHRLLPASAEAVLEEDGMPTAGGGGAPNNFMDVITNMANSLKHMGFVIREKAAGARDAIGKLLIELGCNLHNLMGQPFGRTPMEEAAAEGSAEYQEGQKKAEMVGRGAITVACAILTMVLLKRVYPIRFV